MSLPIIPRVALRFNSISCNSRVISTSRRCLTPYTPIFFPKSSRAFTTSPTLHKKAGKANKAHARTDSTPPNSASSASLPTATDDAFDLSNLEASVLRAIEKLTHELSQLRSGGRLNPEIVEGLKVSLGVAGKDGSGKETVRLGDIAQVVPRGRVLHILCGEADHVKPISTAIAASPHSLTPLAPEATTPLTILVPLPPPTGESRRRAVEKAGQAATEADKWIQNSRQVHNKALRKKGLEKSVLPDDLQKAGKLMEEVVKKGHGEVKRIVEGAKRVLESQ